jgi:hypothetical protein
MYKPPSNPSLSMKLVLFMDKCPLKCSLSMKSGVFMDKSSRRVCQPCCGNISSRMEISRRSNLLSCWFVAL